MFCWLNTWLNIKLFQLKMKLSVVAVTTPGPERGSRIFKKADCCVSPSTIAASSSSLGTESKYGDMTQTTNGRAMSI
ncbi:hypothetical protein DSECCO2_458740 [anaerobic digester metagenome]